MSYLSPSPRHRWRRSPWRHQLMVIAAGWMLAPLVRFADHFLFSDWEFAGFLAVMVALDTASGMMVAWRRCTLSAKNFQPLLVKIFAYAVALMTIHALSHHTIAGEPNTILGKIVPYFDAVMYAAILFREALSIHEHLTSLGHPLLPRAIQKHLHRYAVEGPDDAQHHRDAA